MCVYKAYHIGLVVCVVQYKLCPTALLTRMQTARGFDAVIPSERFMTPKVPPVYLAQQQCPFFTVSLELGWSP